MSVRKIARSILIFILPILFAGCGAVRTSTPAPAPTPRFAFVANLFSNRISIYAVDPQTGHLSLKGTVPSGGTNPRVITVEPSGRFAYVGNVVSNDISVFAIDSNTGSLTMVGSLFPPATVHGSLLSARREIFFMQWSRTPVAFLHSPSTRTRAR